jgi:cytochrome d ubiquinol oxidase subunit II
MTIVVVVFLPLVLIYQAWTYYVFRRRVSASEFQPAAPRPAAAPDEAADQDAMRTTNREGRHV